MRTTLTLEDDVAQGLRQAAKDKKTTFKAVVNDMLRAGLAAEKMAVEQEEETKGKVFGRVRYSEYGVPVFDSGKILIPQDMPASLALELYEDEKPL